jgi:hypothetical protein
VHLCLASASYYNTTKTKIRFPTWLNTNICNICYFSFCSFFDCRWNRFLTEFPVQGTETEHATTETWCRTTVGKVMYWVKYKFQEIRRSCVQFALQFWAVGVVRRIRLCTCHLWVCFLVGCIPHVIEGQLSFTAYVFSGALFYESRPILTTELIMSFFFFFFLYWCKGCRKQFCLLWLPRAVDFKVSSLLTLGSWSNVYVFRWVTLLGWRTCHCLFVKNHNCPGCWHNDVS